MHNSEIEAYTGSGRICQNICVNADFNEKYSENHKWSDVPFPLAKRIRIRTSKGKFEQDLPVSCFDLPYLGSPDEIRRVFAAGGACPSSANWFQIYNTLNALAKKAGRRYVVGLKVVDKGETLEFILEKD